MTDVQRTVGQMVTVIPPRHTDSTVEEITLPMLRRRGSVIKRRKSVREEITDVVEAAAPDQNVLPIIEAVAFLAKEKGWN